MNKIIIISLLLLASCSSYDNDDKKPKPLSEEQKRDRDIINGHIIACYNRHQKYRSTKDEKIYYSYGVGKDGELVGLKLSVPRSASPGFLECSQKHIQDFEKRKFDESLYEYKANSRRIRGALVIKAKSNP